MCKHYHHTTINPGLTGKIFFTQSGDTRQCRGLLGICPDLPQISKKTCQEMILQFTGFDISICPHCKKGNMIIIEEIPKHLNIYSYKPKILDSS